MPSLFPVGPGRVISADIAAPDVERLRAFYARVLCTGDPPLWRADDLHNSLGLPIIGIGARTSAHEALPVQWMPHIQVSDVHASLERATARGAAVLMQGHMPSGDVAWAVLQDPAGAVFGLVPSIPSEAIPALPVPTPPTGRVAWLDLTVPDADALRDFYAIVVGWGTQAVAMRDGEHAYADYCLLNDDGTTSAGVCHARGPNAGLPPVWLLYLPVGDLEASIHEVTEAGGMVLTSSRKPDGSYASAVIRDPAGAFTSLVPA